MTDEEKDKLKKILDSAHINFLIGSGASCDYLKTLSNIENLLSDSEKQLVINPKDKKEIQINYSIKYKYFEDCVKGNLSFKDNSEIIGNEIHYKDTYESYDKLLNAINTILIRRKTSVINRQVNLFTTNMDLFLDDVLEKNSLNFNDGFSGRMKPEYSTSNYKKSVFQSSSHYDNISEIPTFNLFKLHGSVNWKKESTTEGYKIVYDNSLDLLDQLNNKKESSRLLPIDFESSINNLRETTSIRGDISDCEGFLKLYNDFVFVNPTKEKFQLTTIDYVFYEQLRMYSNALEKESSVLFVHGFSFADEHIKEITVRAAKSNPTLIIYIFCFNEKEKQKIQKFFKGTNNVEYICDAEEYAFHKQVDDYLFKLAEEFDTNFWKSKENRKSEIEVSTDIEPKEAVDEQ